LFSPENKFDPLSIGRRPELFSVEKRSGVPAELDAVFSGCGSGSGFNAAV